MQTGLYEVDRSRLGLSDGLLFYRPLGGAQDAPSNGTDVDVPVDVPAIRRILRRRSAREVY